MFSLSAVGNKRAGLIMLTRAVIYKYQGSVCVKLKTAFVAGSVDVINVNSISKRLGDV